MDAETQSQEDQISRDNTTHLDEALGEYASEVLVMEGISKVPIPQLLQDVNCVPNIEFDAGVC